MSRSAYEVKVLNENYLANVTEGLDRDEMLEFLMRDYGQDVWNYAFFLTRRRELADDISQDVFVRVYDRMQTYRGQASIRTWLLTITRNMVKDHWKQAWTRRVTLFWNRIVSVGEQAPSAEDEALRSMARDEIWTCVLSLSSKLREPLLLYAHYGCSYEEIAGILQVSKGTVKSRISRARASVEEKLAAIHPQQEGVE